MLIKKIYVYKCAHRASCALLISPCFFPHPLFEVEHSLREFALNICRAAGKWICVLISEGF